MGKQDGVVYSEEIREGIKVEINGILIIGTKIEHKKQAS